MATQFEAHTTYLGEDIVIKSDNFEELHRALAGVNELNQDANYLYSRLKKEDGKAPRLVPAYRKDNDENEYFGITEVTAGGRGRNMTFGKKRDQTALVSFFPKGEEGYYDPDNPPQRNGQRSGGQRGRQQNSQRGQQQRQSGGLRQGQNHQRQPAGQSQGGGGQQQGDPNDGLPF